MPQNDPSGGDERDSGYNRRTILTGSITGLLASSGLVSADDGREPGPKEDEILIGVSPSVSNIEREVGPAMPAGAQIEHTNDTIHYAVVSFPEATPDFARETVIETLESIDVIEYAEPNATLEAFATPNDPHYRHQHAPQQVNCEEAWETTLGSEDVVISVVDQGIQYDHPVLEPNMEDSVSNHGNDFAGYGSDPYPAGSDEQHGTHVGAIAAGSTDEGVGHAGISNCSLLSARALDRQGQGALSDIADAIQWSVDAGADIVNLSLGASSGYRTLRAACRYAVDNGVLLVGAAGNSGSYGVAYPAAYDEVVAVSALTSSNGLASFSNRGPDIDLAAPGSRIVSAVPWDGYARMSGTSMAAPVVSGVAGLVLSAYPGLSGAELRDHLTKTAVDVGLSSNAQGYGRVDAAAAVTTAPDGYEPDESDGRVDDDESDENDTDDIDDIDGHLLAFVTDSSAQNAAYEFTADGPVEITDAPYESPSGGSIGGNGNDTIEESDGAYHVSGLTGGGYGDAFAVDGAVTSIDIDQPDVMWVELDGERLSPDEVVEETGGQSDEDEDEDDADGTGDNLLAFVTDSSAQNATYEFTADGPVEITDAPYESPSGGSIGGNGNDTIEESDGTWHVSGLTGGGYGDAFTVDGAVTSIDIDQPDAMWVELDGERMSPDEIIDETGGQPDDEDETEEPTCGDETATASADGELDGNWWGDNDRYTYALRTANPCSATVTLETAGDADFGLYVTTDGRSPSRYDYDERDTGENLEITIDLEGDESLGLQARAVNGSGTYTLTVEESGR